MLSHFFAFNLGDKIFQYLAGLSSNISQEQQFFLVSNNTFFSLANKGDQCNIQKSYNFNSAKVVTQNLYGPAKFSVTCRRNFNYVCLFDSHFNQTLKSLGRDILPFNSSALVKAMKMLKEVESNPYCNFLFLWFSRLNQSIYNLSLF